MLTVIKSKYLGEVESSGIMKNLVLAEMALDSSVDLPEVDYQTGQILAQGSIAWDISTGDFYGLNSSGSWINQTAPAAAQGNGKSLTLSSPLQKGESLEIEQPEEKELEILETEGEEKGVEDDESVRDTESK